MDTITQAAGHWRDEDLFAPITPTVNWRLTTGGRLFGGVITGRAGSGKTTLLRRIARGARDTDVNVHLADPIGTAAIEGFASSCHRVDDLLALLEWSETEIDGLLDAEQSAREAAPAHLIAIDHAEFVLDDPRIRDQISRIARRGGHLGLAVIICGSLGSAQLPHGTTDGNLIALPTNSLTEPLRIGFERAARRFDTACYADPFTGETTTFDHRA